MKRAEVRAKAKELGIESEKFEEFLDYIFDVNGADVNKAKQGSTNDLQELESLRTYKTETEAKLAGYKDYEDLKKFKADALAKEENQRKIDFLKANGCNYPELMVGQVDWSKAKYDETSKSYTGLEEAVKGLKGTYSGMFTDTNAQQPHVYQGGPQNNQSAFEAYKAAHPNLKF